MENARLNDSGSWFERLKKRLRSEPEDDSQLLELLRNAERRHLVHPETLAMIEGAMQIEEMRVRDIMIPRSQMVVVQDGTGPEEFLPIITDSGHSRFPLFDKKGEQVIGILLAKDLLNYLAQPEETKFDIKDVIRKPVFVPESKRLNILLREFRTSRNHMAIVVDEYGVVAGLVTIEDVIEQVVGEIDDEHDVDEEDLIRSYRRSRFVVKARTPLDVFNKYFGTNFVHEEYDTIGGMVMQLFGRLPQRGETLDYEGFSFEILRADGRRIHTMRVIPHKALPARAEGKQE